MKRRVRERVVGVSAEDDGEEVDEVGRELIVVCHWPSSQAEAVGHTKQCHTTCHMSHRNQIHEYTKNHNVVHYSYSTPSCSSTSHFHHGLGSNARE